MSTYHALIIKISSMGDIIHTLPAVTDAANFIPNVLFDWVVEETFAEIPQWHLSVFQVIPIKLRLWKKKWYTLRSWKEYNNYITQVGAKKYDAIIDAQGLLKTSLFATYFAVGIKHGLDRFSAKEPISCWVYDKCYRINKIQHAIERIRKLFAYSLGYSVPSCIGQYNIRHIFQSCIKKSEAPYLILLHSTTCLLKCWPESSWLIFIQKVLKFSDYRIKIPFWTKREEWFVKCLKNYFSQIIVLPHLTLWEVSIQIIQASAIISVDTGLSHLAAAYDCSNLTLYGPTNPELIGTYGLNQTILRSKTGRMDNLHPEFVWSKFKDKFFT
ncbi:lipopolysaccharide heptosyltransferase I [Candidatus Blochmanniella vafra str. BVAF]|uniref:Lipopolysaccharide heptosyltransferase 1 n=1 Tax=Blochmanniella vafra (strain BVAF) TaxID=859654 RepID=E8Q787_BLOVB|nr:lipopolysaccharide heptosyltransferase I [Candidatus Blochmannia vafer]ADV33982.1 lipopolysaccharide heptosyltransferase I [Candidatus Blochmannia vafer str. BVAF]